MTTLPPAALVADVDGTLVDQTFVLSPAVRDALSGLVARNIPVLLSTGKPLQSCIEYIEPLKLRGYHSFCAGAHVCDFLGKGDLYVSRLPTEGACEAIAECRDADITLELYTPDKFFISHDNKFVGLEETFIRVKPIVEPNLQMVARSHDVVKLQIVLETQREKRDGHRIMDRFAEQFAFSLGHVHGLREIDFYSFMQTGISKRTALKRTAEAMEIPLERIVAIGDSTGDIGLLEAAGIGIAMGDALEEVKQAADYIVAPLAEDGLAEAVARFFPA